METIKGMNRFLKEETGMNLGDLINLYIEGDLEQIRKNIQPWIEREKAKMEKAKKTCAKSVKKSGK